MAEKTAISWSDSTWNAWVGCEKVSPACTNCYAEKWAIRAGTPELWQGQRRRTKTWGDPLKWQRNALEFKMEHGRRRRVFTNSLSDFFDKDIDPQWREEAWAIVRACTEIEWYIVTKRVPNVVKMVPLDFCESLYRHIVIITTVVNQDEADRDIPRLTALKELYPWLRIGLSIEPMLAPMVLRCSWLDGLDWVIVGGESGDQARPMMPNWATSILRQCLDAKVPFHFKQIGHNNQAWGIALTGKGAKPEEWPAELRVQEFPREPWPVAA